MGKPFLPSLQKILFARKFNMDIEYTEWGLANRFNNRIEINKALRHKKRLHEYILNHELSHKPTFDVWHEAAVNWFIMPELMLFIASHPKTWIDFLPLQKRKEGWVYDLNLFVLYGIVGLLGFGLYKVITYFL